MCIRAIETEYNGYRFRSRLEARWAVFFEEAEIPFEYEPEGFILKDGTHYLPDFYLPWFKCFVEIKRMNLPNKDKQEAVSKLEELFDLHGDCCAMLAEGDPMDSKMTVYCNDITDSSGGGPLPWNAQFIQGGWFNDNYSCHSGGKRFITLCLGEKNDRKRSFYTSNFELLPCVEQLCCMASYRSKLGFAQKTARQARFEHGENRQRKEA